jgi:catechol 2,3-dioxygenase-like lactoylglutathione lyase family enzyme
MRKSWGPIPLLLRWLAVFIFAWTVKLAGGAEATKPTVDLAIYGRVVQVGWVVKDLDRVVSYWEKLGLRNVNRTGVLEFPDNIYRGKKTPLSLKMAFAHIGDVRIEWIQPVKGKSVYKEFLRKHGDGVYCLAYGVPSSEALREQIKYFGARGVTVVQEGSWQGTKGTGRYAYLDTAAKGGGLTIELVCNPDAPPGGATEKAENVYPFSQIAQYAFVVRDLKKVGAFYERLGFGSMPVDHNINVVDRNFRGQPGKFEMDLGWSRWGSVPFEWIQSLVGPNVYEEHLKAHGEGFHHLGFAVTDMDQAVELLKARGAPVAQSGGWDTPQSKGRFAYLDTEAYGGVSIELLWTQPPES